MATKTAEIRIVGNSANAVRALEEAGIAAETVGKKMEDRFAVHTSKIGGMFHNLANIAANWGVPFTGSIDKIGTKLDEAKSKGSGFTGFLASTGIPIVSAAAAAIVGIGAESVHMADKFESSHAALQTAIVNSGNRMSTFQGTIDAQTNSFALLGYNQGQYEAGLASLVTATNNPELALHDMGVVADLAATAHVSLSKAAIGVGKALEGQFRPLKQLGIDVPVAATNAVKLQQAQDNLTTATEKAFFTHLRYNDGLLKGKNALDQVEKADNNVKAAQDRVNTAASAGDKVISFLGQRLSGAAARQAETFQGKLKTLEAQLTNVGIKIGLFLIPIISDLVTWISTKAIPWVEKLGPKFAAAWDAVSSGAQAAAKWVQGAWQTISGAATDAWNTIKDTVGKIITGALDVLQAAVDAFKGHWADAWKHLTDGLGDIVDGVVNIFDRIVGVLGNIISMAGQASDALHKLTGISITNPTGGHGSGTFGPFGGFFKSVFGAEGGLFNSPTMKIIGEAGPEALVPLSKPTRAAQVLTAAGLIGGGGGVVIHNHFHGPILDLASTDKFIHESQLRQQARVGNLGYRAKVA